MVNYFLYLFELGSVLAILIILFKERKDKKIFEDLVLAFLYGLFLETINVHLSQSYSYSANFILQIYNIPLAIGTGWAIIYYSAYKLSQSYNLKWWQSPFLMALIALSFDLAIDVIAIRMEFWNWKIPLNQEWFGVPYDNLFGWLAVIWTFSLLTNFSYQKSADKKLAKLIKYSAVAISPFLLSLQITAYVTLSAVLSGRLTANEILKFYKDGNFEFAYYPEVQVYKAYIFLFVVIALIIYLLKAIYRNKNKITAKTDFFSLAILLLAHAFFLVSIFVFGIYQQIPMIAAISILMIFFHITIGLFPAILRLARNKNDSAKS
jgi:uncharacterized membrane protein